MASRTPAPPRGSGPAGRALWRDVLKRFELDEHEAVLLREAVRTADQLDQLDAAVRVDGVLLEGRAHPALVEARQQRLVLARLLASLRLPEEESDARPQRRGAARAPYRTSLRSVGRGA